MFWFHEILHQWWKTIWWFGTKIDPIQLAFFKRKCTLLSPFQKKMSFNCKIKNKESKMITETKHTFYVRLGSHFFQWYHRFKASFVSKSTPKFGMPLEFLCIQGQITPWPSTNFDIPRAVRVIYLYIPISRYFLPVFNFKHKSFLSR